MDTPLKNKLLDLCQQQVEERINNARQAMEAAQAAANNEGKSSAGDKYETGRAMMQIERNQHARLLAEALKLKQSLDGIDPDRKQQQIGIGSLVHTNKGTYYISVSLGKLHLDGKEYMAISPVTPLGKALAGLQKGSKLVFNNMNVQILELS